MDKFFVSNRIKKLREAKKLTQNALANKAGISPTYIYQLERGNKSPTIEYLGYICDALKISLSDFFSDEYFEKTNSSYENLTSYQKQLIDDLIKSFDGK